MPLQKHCKLDCEHLPEMVAIVHELPNTPSSVEGGNEMIGQHLIFLCHANELASYGLPTTVTSITIEMLLTVL